MSNLTSKIIKGAIATLLTTPVSPVIADDLVDALKGGKYGGYLNVRFEGVEDDAALRTDNEAEALTARATLFFTSGEFYKTYFHVEFEHVQDLLDDNEYFDGTNAGITRTATNNLPAIVDPEGTEVNQAFVGFKPFSNTEIKLGRQMITPRKAPFHRFLGNVLWRQNWSTQDAVTITNTSLPNTTILAGYIWNNNFINQANRDMQAPIFNVQYKGFKYAKLEAYYYDLNFTDVSTALGNESFGGRISGAYPISKGMNLIYAGEYATQSDSDDNPLDYDADYYLAEGGFKFTFSDMFIKSLLAKVSYEVMEGDVNAGAAFQTPLATGHAYFGWADNFLVTPATGIEDTYFTVVAAGKYDTKIILAYHMFDAEDASFEYGDEFNVWFTKTFKKKYTLGLKYADYQGTSDVGNPRSTDLSRYWAYLELKF